MPATKVLDAFAVLAFLYDETGAEPVQKCITEVDEGRVNLIISMVNLGEVWYCVARNTSPKVADQTIQDLLAMGIESIEVDWGITHQAALYKSKGNISYADTFAAALAKLRNCPVVTGDKEFKQLEREIKIEWLE